MQQTTEAEEIAEWEAKYLAGGVGYGTVKKRVVELLCEYFRPYRQRREELERDRDFVEDVLRDGARRARDVARTTMNRVRDAVGLGKVRNA